MESRFKHIRFNAYIVAVFFDSISFLIADFVLNQSEIILLT